MSGNPYSTWRDIVKRLLADVGRNKQALMAAGIAFYGVLSIAPTLAALVSFYGLVYDPAAVEAQIAALEGVVPKEALDVISNELARVVSTDHSRLGIGLVVSLTIALGTAASGTSALMTALNVAYETDETRGIVSYYASSLALAAGLLLFGTFSLTLLAALPAIVDLVPMGALGQIFVGWLRWPVLGILAGIAITAIYRYGPSRNAADRGWVSWGALAATILWIAGSALFSVYLHISVYIGKLPTSSETYGAFGAVVALLMWLWLSAFAVLLGGALDAKLKSLSHATVSLR